MADTNDAKEISWRTVRRVVYAPGTHPDFPEGFFAEDVIFDEIPDPRLSRIEACYDPATKTVRLFAKSD